MISDKVYFEGEKYIFDDNTKTWVKYVKIPKVNFNMNRHLIPFSNGKVWDINKNIVRGITKEDLFSKTFNVEYNPNANPKEIKDFLSKTTSDPGELHRVIKYCFGCVQRWDTNLIGKIIKINESKYLLNLIESIFGHYCTTQEWTEDIRLLMDNNILIPLPYGLSHSRHQIDYFEEVRCNKVFYFLNPDVLHDNSLNKKLSVESVPIEITEENKSAFMNWLML